MADQPGKEGVGTSEQVMIRMSAPLLARVDAYMAGLQVRNPGMTVSRADAIRNLIERGLETAMDDHTEHKRQLVASLTYMSRLEAEMASEHGAPSYAGVSPSDVAILNGYLQRAKLFCPNSEPIQTMVPLDNEAWYGQYLALLNSLANQLAWDIEAPGKQRV